MKSPLSVFIGDANNDGYNDIVTVNQGDDDVKFTSVKRRIRKY